MAIPLLIPRTWGCTPTPERNVAHIMSDATQTPGLFALASVVDAVFSAASPSWAETRRLAWQANWNVERGTVVIDDVEFDVYFANQSWMTEVWACRLGGGCAIDAPPCLQVSFYNSP